MLQSWGQGGGLNAGLSFWLPLSDSGAGAVNTTPASSAGSATATFTRATTATTILSTGLIGSVSSGVARSCYSPAGVYLGYLAEEARTNLCLQSADLSNASWVKGAVTIGGSVTLPDGTTGTVNKIQEDNTTANHLVKQVFTKAASSLAYTVTAYLKQAERTWAFIDVNDGTNSARGFFNLGTGAIGSTATGGSGFTVTATSVVQAANGFYRCVFSFTSPTSTTLNVQVAASTGDLVTSYLGTTGSGIYAWGAQLEQAAFATSYIPTTTVAVTRNGDVLTYPASGNVNGSSGTTYSEFTSGAASGTTQKHLLSTISGSEGIAAYVDSTNLLSLYDGTSGRSGAGLSVTFPASSIVKAATNWNGSASGFALSGSVASALFDGAMGFAANMAVGSNPAGGANLNGTIKNVRIWTHALADSQLVSLTS